MSETAAKKSIQKLQRAIVDGLDDVKAQDVRVFNTEHLSPLFERVIVASGTSNRQTKALAASVRDKVREAGLAKPRVEGEDNGEWIVVDCGPAVAHIMQPAIRQYYNLEEIWGDKPVRLKGPSNKATATRRAAAADEAKKSTRVGAKSALSATQKVAADGPKSRSAAGSAAAAPKVPAPARKTPARKTAAATTAVAKKAPARKAPARTAAGTASAPRKSAAPRRPRTADLPTVVVNKPTARTAAKTAAAKSAPKPASRSAIRPAAKPASRTPAKTSARKTAPR